jgi:hypothetical protein
MSLPKLYLRHCPDGPPAGIYQSSLWSGQRLLQAADEAGKLYIFIGPESATPAGWYTIEKETSND